MCWRKSSSIDTSLIIPQPVAERVEMIEDFKARFDGFLSKIKKCKTIWCCWAKKLCGFRCFNTHGRILMRQHGILHTCWCAGCGAFVTFGNAKFRMQKWDPFIELCGSPHSANDGVRQCHHILYNKLILHSHRDIKFPKKPPIFINYHTWWSLLGTSQLPQYGELLITHICTFSRSNIPIRGRKIRFKKGQLRQGKTINHQKSLLWSQYAIQSVYTQYFIVWHTHTALILRKHAVFWG